MTVAAAGLLGAPAVAHASLPVSFGAASYAPGQVAYLHVQGPARAETVQVLRAGLGSGLGLAPVDSPWRARGPTIPVHVWNWPSGVYFAQVSGPGGRGLAPFVLRPRQLGASRIAVVEPTYTWQAYNDFAGDSWYFGGPDTVQLTRPYLDGGVPPHFAGYDAGFLHWLVRTGRSVDVLSDEDLEHFGSAQRLAQLYDLIVFPGHEEYVTQHVYDLVQGYRDRGGNLAFLSADDFFYRISRGPDTITRLGRWRDVGRPEAALVGEQYVNWDERTYPNEPYTVVAGDSWLFVGTGLHTGSRFGNYGIEIDSTTPQSPPGTQVLADIPDDFGPGENAQMTYYELGAAKVFSAGVMNFGGSADWPVVSTILDNLWARLSLP